MYNLFVSGSEECWTGEPWEIEVGRFSEYTDDAIKEQFGKLSAVEADALRRLPCIFAYESHRKKAPKFGVILSVEKRRGQVLVKYEIKDVDPFLSAEDLSSLATVLDIHKLEMNRTHWAVKNIDLAKELRGQGINLPVWDYGSKKTIDITSHKFDVALSFSGEFRAKVELIASALRESLGIDACFYDDYYMALLARPALDTLLQDVYKNRSKLIVVFFGGDYQTKEWCAIEFRAIEEVINRDPEKVMCIRMEDKPVDGILKAAGYIDGYRFGPNEIADFIRQRVESPV